MLPPNTARSPHLIKQRLRLEAALRHREFDIVIVDGELCIQADSGLIPVKIESLPPEGGRVTIEILMGTSPNPESELRDYVENANLLLGEVVLLLSESGEVSLRLVQEFGSEINIQDTIDATSALGAAYREIGKELKERFFLQSLGKMERAGGGE